MALKSSGGAPADLERSKSSGFAQTSALFCDGAPDLATAEIVALGDVWAGYEELLT